MATTLGTLEGHCRRQVNGRRWPAAWTAVDYVKGGADLEFEYAVLAKLCGEMLDVNCVGLYVPGKRTFIPNDDSFRRILAERRGFTPARLRADSQLDPGRDIAHAIPPGRTRTGAR